MKDNEFENEELNGADEPFYDGYDDMLTEASDDDAEMPEAVVGGSGQAAALPKTNWKKELFEWAEVIIVAVVITFIVRTFLFNIVEVDGSSMEDTLHTYDRLFVQIVAYTPKNGDIIVFTPERRPNEPFIKRVIGIPGQTVDIDFTRGIVMVDGEIIEENYIKNPTTKPGDVQFPVTVPEGYFFALGDNRAASHDCRSSSVGSVDNKSGLVKNESIMGKALFRIWPLSKFGGIY